MKLFPLIQYVDRFHSQHEAQECLEGLSNLVGYVAGRVNYSPTFNETREYACQVFFEYEEGINPEALEICGFRSVSVPLPMLVSMLKA